MSNEEESDIEAILDAYDQYHEERQDEIRQAEEAGARYDAEFRQVIATVIRPYFEEVALQLETHGHAALVEEGSISSPDHRLAGGSKITLAFLPKERTQQSLRHQLELNDAPHLMLRCDKRRRVIELFEEPDLGFLNGGADSALTWSVKDVTRGNLRKRVLPMIRETLIPSDRRQQIPRPVGRVSRGDGVLAV